MKKFIESVLAIKLNACLIFTGTIFILLAVNLFTDIIPISAPILWQFLLISLVGSAFQWIAFGGTLLKDIRYAWRCVIFILPFFAFLALCAWLFAWFPLNQFISWMIFCGIFLLIFIGISIGISIYEHATGKKYNAKLGEFKQKAE